MAGRRAEAAEPIAADGQRAYDERGNVRPADDRYLSDEQIAAKDATEGDQA